VQNCKSFLVTEAERKQFRRHAPFQQRVDASKAPKEIHGILTETLEDHAPSYATVTKWVAQFKRGEFSTFVAPRPVRTTTMAAQEITVQIHELILEDHRISAKSITEQLASHLRELGPSFIQISTCRTSPRSGSRNT